ncbi:flagellar hook-length control protein FliK [Alicyclobacillus cellulosilyticus]|uniref:flagellar hook-length control protein FliK n=1 Tax=Alicyclobacillus cellulosilyticus TaxID=1003997 RepID=UPI001665E298|nr:flagellar hook-length control protein FliK [Alicyclobacillus cellulosilyticus]
MANPVDVSWWLAAASGTGMTTAGAAVQTGHDTPASATLDQPQAGDHAARTGAGPPPAFVHTVASAARDAALGQTSLRLEVRPQGLGDLTIDVKRGEGGVFVHVQAEHPQVQAALQAAAGEIVQAIVQQGVQVAQFQVGPLVNADGHGNPHPRSQPPPGRLGGRDEARTAREDATRVRSGQDVAIAWLGQALDRRV